MITFTHGNIFDAKTDGVINPTNARGPMGAGLAKQFRDRFPGLEAAYKDLCKKSRVLGKAWVFGTRPGDHPTWRCIICCPTKDHWKDPSEWGWIADGLFGLSGRLHPSITSIAVPPLGCGLGGLKWDEIKPKLIAVLEAMPKIHWVVYEP